MGMGAEAAKVGRWLCLGFVLEWLSMTGSWGDRGRQGKGIWELTFANPSSLETPSAYLAPCEGHARRDSVSSHRNPVNLELWEQLLK